MRDARRQRRGESEWQRRTSQNVGLAASAMSTFALAAGLGRYTAARSEADSYRSELDTAELWLAGPGSSRTRARVWSSRVKDRYGRSLRNGLPSHLATPGDDLRPCWWPPGDERFALGAHVRVGRHLELMPQAIGETCPRAWRRSTSSGHDVATDAPTTPGRNLLVDDDAALAFMLAEVLESAGYEVTIAGTGAAARAEVELHQPDLIILGLILPDEDGLVLCTVLKNLASAPILISSGGSAVALC